MVHRGCVSRIIVESNDPIVGANRNRSLRENFPNYSAEINNSSIAALNPRFNKIGLMLCPTVLRRSNFCIFCTVYDDQVALILPAFSSGS